jgi:hypothetical protein
MSDDQTLYGAIAVVTACIVFIVRAVLAAKSGVEAVAVFDKYKSYALLAAKWTEATIPDTIGSDADAGGVKKSLAKLDVYLKKFTELVKENENTLPNTDLINMAKAWSVELAAQVEAGKAAK